MTTGLSRHVLAFALCTGVLISTTAFGKAPETISFQGRITDAGGAPVPDGSYTVDFTLYDAPIGGTLLWQELGVMVATTDGLFTAILGDPTPFPQDNLSITSNSPFLTGDTVWLEIAVEGGAMTPRTRLESVPFAQSARDISGWATDGSGSGIRSNTEVGTLVTYGEGGEERVRVWGPSWGEIFLWSDAAGPNAVLSSGPVAGYMTLLDPTSSQQIALYANGAGDGTVYFPDDAINAQEILNEPGIAYNRLASTINLTRSNTSQDIVSVTLSTPAAGYIVLDGHFYHRILNADSAAFGWAQISETSNAPQEGGHHYWSGGAHFGNNSSAYSYYTLPLHRVYFKLAGTYTFYLQGNLYTADNTDVSGSAFQPSWLQAAFYPTSYGSVATVAPVPGDGPGATAVIIEDPVTGETTTAYSIDLRHYELRAREAELAAIKAQRELDLARRRAQIKLGDQTPTDTQN